MGKTPFSEEDRVDEPASLYAATKKANEMMACTYNHIFGLSMIGLRFFTVYGPWGRPDMAAFSFAKETAVNKVYNLGNKDPVTVSYLVECLETSLGKSANRNYMPMPPTGDVLKTSADVTKAEAELGYKPTTPLHVGIDKFVQWYQEYFKDGMAKDVQVYVPY